MWHCAAVFGKLSKGKQPTCPIAAPARLPIARPDELTVLSQIRSCVRCKLSQQISHKDLKIYMDHHGSVLSGIWVHAKPCISSLCFPSSSRGWIQAELQAANWSELMFFSSSCSQCFPISLYSLAVANLYPLVLRSPFRRDIRRAIFWGYRWAKHVPETLWATNASLLLAVTYVISINIHAYVYIYIFISQSLKQS